MELREFAERVVRGETLEEKLDLPVGEMTDEVRGDGVEKGLMPGRPAGLEFEAKEGRRRLVLPGAHQLESGNEEQRGILLHFFANHELLATELMALVLLKFPGAPGAFRRGVLNTLKEEQRHTKWYLERMRECGVRFGDLPVSGYFWDAVAPMETPLDYVTRLSLMFEQANLDYSKHYAGIFGAVGDKKTAKILERIYRDEIGHVGYGLKWFRKWKGEGETDWEAFEKRLVFPLSPSRAKGNGALFNAAGRLEAGMDEGFVNQLELFERSKGRTPNVFVFFPDEEAAMAGGLDGKGYAAREEVASLASDLEILPAFLARRDDVVLVRRLPSESQVRRLRAAGFELPEFEALGADGGLAEGSLVGERKLNRLRPWGWGPQSAGVLGALVGNLPGEARIEDFWNERRWGVYSKAWEAELLGGATVCGSMDEVLAAVEALRGEGATEAVLKALFGASGQKNQVVSTGWAEGDGKRRWAERMLSQQGGLVVEAWEARVTDFSVQYEMGDEGLRKLGVVRVENDGRGQFVSASCGPKICQGLEGEVTRFLMEKAFPLYEEGAALVRRLEAGLRESGYAGPVGVDALVFREKGGRGELRLREVVEVNPRYTMGRVAWELMGRVAPGHWVRFGIRGREESNVTESTSAQRSSSMERESEGAESFEGEVDETGKMTAGSLVLNDVDRAERVWAVLRVAKRWEDLVFDRR